MPMHAREKETSLQGVVHVITQTHLITYIIKYKVLVQHFHFLQCRSYMYDLYHGKV